MISLNFPMVAPVGAQHKGLTDFRSPQYGRGYIASLVSGAIYGCAAGPLGPAIGFGRPAFCALDIDG
jgi:hypothetical protein